MTTETTAKYFLYTHLKLFFWSKKFNTTSIPPQSPVSAILDFFFFFKYDFQYRFWVSHHSYHTHSGRKDGKKGCLPFLMNIPRASFLSSFSVVRNGGHLFNIKLQYKNGYSIITEYPLSFALPYRIVLGFFHCVRVILLGK